MSFAKHQAFFTTKLQGQNLATFSHSAVTPIAYLQHTVNTINAIINAIKKINAVKTFLTHDKILYTLASLPCNRKSSENRQNQTLLF